MELGGARLVLASDSHPKQIKCFSEALTSRCLRGMVVQIQPPDLQTRVKIIKSLVSRREIHMLDSAVEELARRCVGSVREIEGMLTKVYAMSTLVVTRPSHTVNQVDTTLSVAESTLIDDTPSLNSPSPTPIGCALIKRLFDVEGEQMPCRAISFDKVLNTVVGQLGATRSQVLGHSRHRHVVLARSLAIYLSRQLTSMSYPEIAAAMGRRTHSTLVTSVQRVEQWLQEPSLWTLPVSGEQLCMADLLARLKQAVLQSRP